jgi:transposase-like protein
MERKKEKPDLEKLVQELAEGLRSGKPLVGREGVFTPLLQKVLEASLEGELDSHLSETRSTQKNRRNGRNRKNVQSSLGGFEIFSPRDRNGSFEPQILKKREHKLSSDMDARILSLYGRGMTYSDIQEHVSEIYGLDISDGAISAITDRILPEIREWQNRPLASVYPVIWLDAIHFKVRENGKVVTKAVHNILGVDCEGGKEVLGIYFGDNESATFWRQVLYELQVRGVKDIFVACIDNLSGFGDAIEDTFPKTDVQLCLVHQMRNSMKYISDRDLRPLVGDLKAVYKALNADMALHCLEQAEEKWGSKYGTVFKSWRANWGRLTSFYRYPPALRRVIYTTNPIESYHRMVRKATKTKGAFTSENAIIKQIYLATINAQTRWKGTIFGWTGVRRELEEHFGDRFINPDTLY